MAERGSVARHEVRTGLLTPCFFALSVPFPARVFLLTFSCLNSTTCATFDSPCLVDGGTEQQRFDIQGVELWGFDCQDALSMNVGAGIIQTAWRSRAPG